jgi:hypothetical protein
MARHDILVTKQEAAEDNNYSTQIVRHNVVVAMSILPDPTLCTLLRQAIHLAVALVTATRLINRFCEN